MSSIYRILTLLLALMALCILPQCTRNTDSSLNVNQQLASPYTQTASSYLELAKQQEGIEKNQSEIMAAGRLVHDGQLQQANRILSQQKHLPKALANEKKLLQAKVDLIRDNPKSAISKLASVTSTEDMSLYNQVQYHEMLANAYRATQNATEAVNERIKLEKLLPDDGSRSNNRRALWLTVTTLPPEEIDTLAIEAPRQSELAGWMQLGRISRKQDLEPQNMLSEIEQWKNQFPEHPAQYILPSSLTQVAPSLHTKPKTIAVLLPLSGKLAGPGEAVHDGVLAAHTADAANGTTQIKFYDTGINDAKTQYQKALSEGADYVIGPLGKQSVAAVAHESHPIPTLLLNDADVSLKPNLYQFGISPSNEARQVATKARKNGNTRALIIAPSGNWGDEISNAFNAQWHANGGTTVDTLHYGMEDNMGQEIRSFLHISESEGRTAALKTLLGKKIQSTPRRRQDFDMIFLLAYPSKARQIMPMLRYYYAGNIPVYAISSVYAGNVNTLKDRDLDGIIFCDMPWVFNRQMGQRNWPEQWNSYNRLYALGMDSYKLSTQLNQLLLFPAMGVSDASGVLYLKSNQQIGRILAWGKFNQGVAREMNEA